MSYVAYPRLNLEARKNLIRWSPKQSAQPAQTLNSRSAQPPLPPACAEESPTEASAAPSSQRSNLEIRGSDQSRLLFSRCGIHREKEMSPSFSTRGVLLRQFSLREAAVQLLLIMQRATFKSKGHESQNHCPSSPRSALKEGRKAPAADSRCGKWPRLPSRLLLLADAAGTSAGATAPRRSRPSRAVARSRPQSTTRAKVTLQRTRTVFCVRAKQRRARLYARTYVGAAWRKTTILATAAAYLHHGNGAVKIWHARHGALRHKAVPCCTTPLCCTV